MIPYREYTDDQLLQRMQKNDEKAFTELYNRHWEQIALYVLKVIRSEEEARDIVQEIFLSIWKRREVLDVKVPLVAYLLRSARNLSLRYIERSVNKKDFLEKLALHIDATGPVPVTDALELKELETKVNKAVDTLPAKMKEIYLLSRMENLSYREIADRLGIAGTTVKKQVSNALKVIRKEIGNDPVPLLLCLILLRG